MVNVICMSGYKMTTWVSSSTRRRLVMSTLPKIRIFTNTPLPYQVSVFQKDGDRTLFKFEKSKKILDRSGFLKNFSDKIRNLQFNISDQEDFLSLLFHISLIIFLFIYKSRLVWVNEEYQTT